MATEVTVSSGPTELIQTADAIQVYMMMELAPGVALHPAWRTVRFTRPRPWPSVKNVRRAAGQAKPPAPPCFQCISPM